jgi:hypothetical protein
MRCTSGDVQRAKSYNDIEFIYNLFKRYFKYRKERNKINSKEYQEYLKKT